MLGLCELVSAVALVPQHLPAEQRRRVSACTGLSSGARIAECKCKNRAGEQKGRRGSDARVRVASSNLEAQTPRMPGNSLRLGSRTVVQRAHPEGGVLSDRQKSRRCECVSAFASGEEAQGPAGNYNYKITVNAVP